MKKIILALLLLASPALAESPTPAPSLNNSRTITTGLTYQTLIIAGNRRTLTIQNNNTTDSCWIDVTGIVASGNTTTTNVTTNAATITSIQASILLTAGQSYGRYYPFTPNAAIVGTCASSGDSIYVDNQ
jgi:hypothetical protein